MFPSHVMLLIPLFSLHAFAAALNNPPSFDKAETYKMLLYAYASYNIPQPGEWECNYCIGETQGFVPVADCSSPLSGAQSYVGANTINKEIVVSFRGSSNVRNWILDFEFVKTPPNATIPGMDPEARIEEGFWKFYKSVRKCITNNVEKLRASYPNFPIKVTGHSLGASGATVAAMDLITNLKLSNMALTTFGEPRTGNPAFAKAVMAAFPAKMRVVNYKDCVPHLPPIEKFDYMHDAFEVYESPSGGGNFTVCNDSGEDPNCSDQWGDLKLNCENHLEYFGISCCDHP